MSFGLRCPQCNCPRTKVTNTTNRFIKWRERAKTMVRRRRVCTHCGKSWYTLETYEEDIDPPNPDTNI